MPILYGYVKSIYRMDDLGYICNALIVLYLRPQFKGKMDSSYSKSVMPIQTEKKKRANLVKRIIHSKFAVT